MGTHYSKYQNLIWLGAFYAFNIVWLLEKQWHKLQIVVLLLQQTFQLFHKDKLITWWNKDWQIAHLKAGNTQKVPFDYLVVNNIRKLKCAG